MKYEKQAFTGDLILDYGEFIACEFTDCNLIMHGGPYSIANGKFTRVRFTLSDAAARTLDFLRMVKAVHPEGFEELMNAKAQPTVASKRTLN